MESKVKKVKVSNPLLEAREEVLSWEGNTSFRMDWIATINEVEFINDAKSVSVEMSLTAIDQCQGNVIWIASDAQLMDEFLSLKGILERKIDGIIYLSNKVNEDLESSCKGLVKNVIRLNTLEEAVNAARSLSLKGNSVLFSPAAPGYFKLDTYQAQGDLFNKVVGDLK